MGKGDKKSRRGKIILGSFGVRRPRKKAYKPEIKPEKIKKVVEHKVVKAEKAVNEVAVTREKTDVKAPKTVKVKKEVKEPKIEIAEKSPKEAKPKKEKKS